MLLLKRYGTKLELFQKRVNILFNCVNIRKKRLYSLEFSPLLLQYVFESTKQSTHFLSVYSCYFFLTYFDRII